MNQQRERIGLNGIILGGFAVMGIAAVVGAALVYGALWTIVGALAVAGGVFVLALAALSLIARFAAPAVVGIGSIRLEAEKERHKHIEKLIEKGIMPESFGYRAIPQLEAPQEQERPAPIKADPRYMLLVNLCLLTIKSTAYGPTSKRLMSANDAQADRSGMFADRMNWDSASKYGQEQGMLYVQQGGKADEQGLKIKCGNGDTAADLLVVLHEKNLILDSAINALPGAIR